jgi:hypothetical protein
VIPHCFACHWIVNRQRLTDSRQYGSNPFHPSRGLLAAILSLFPRRFQLPITVVYDVNRKERIARMDANDLDEAKKKSEGLAAGYLHYRGAGSLPESQWQLNAQSKAAS